MLAVRRFFLGELATWFYHWEYTIIRNAIGTDERSIRSKYRFISETIHNDLDTFIDFIAIVN